MGMFDDIYLETPVKCSCGLERHNFQTKQFDCCMTLYTVTKEGKFIIEKKHMEPNPKYKEGETGILSEHWEPPFLWVKDGEEEIKETFTLSCYDLCDECEAWIDYEAVFIDGKMRGKPKITITPRNKR